MMTIMPSCQMRRPLMATLTKPSKDKGDNRYRGIALVHSHICCLVNPRETICTAREIVRPLERILCTKLAEAGKWFRLHPNVERFYGAASVGLI